MLQYRNVNQSAATKDTFKAERREESRRKKRTSDSEGTINTSSKKKSFLAPCLH